MLNLRCVVPREAALILSKLSDTSAPLILNPDLLFIVILILYIYIYIILIYNICNIKMLIVSDTIQRILGLYLQAHRNWDLWLLNSMLPSKPFVAVSLFLKLHFRSCLRREVVLLMEEILHHLGCIKPCK